VADEDCTHTHLLHEGIKPEALDYCPECVAKGDGWVHLRVCLTCGHVGCCDESPNRHARRHWHSANHPLIQSLEPGENWRYCFEDDVELPPGPMLRR
jgi:CPA2 family monovalent cation:H+ antiporter-2